MIVLVLPLAAVLRLAGFGMFLVLGVPAQAAEEIFCGTMPDPAVVRKIYRGIDHVTLPAIPFFIVAAHLMGSGQIARTLTALVRTLVGHARGGMGQTVTGGPMAFGSVSGSAPATVATMGRMVCPEMRKAGFPDRFSLGLRMASTETAPLIPFSITFVIYGRMTGTSLARLFAGGLAVGLFLGLAFAAMVWIEARRPGIAPEAHTTSGRPWPRPAARGLGAPQVRDRPGRHLCRHLHADRGGRNQRGPRDLRRDGRLPRVRPRQPRPRHRGQRDRHVRVFIPLALGGPISFHVTLARGPGRITDLPAAMEAGPVQFLPEVDLCFLVAGMFVDPNAALLVLVPQLYRAANALGIDPVQFGVIVTREICLGWITPPFGLDIVVGSSTLRKSVTEFVAGSGPSSRSTSSS